MGVWLPTSFLSLVFEGEAANEVSAVREPALLRARPSLPSSLTALARRRARCLSLRRGGRGRGAIFLFPCVLAASIGLARAEGESVGLWIKNTAPVAVAVTIDGAPACSLEAPVYQPCHDKITQLTPNKKTCTTNNLKISCITDVKASGAAVRLKRADGIEYNVRAGKEANLYLCIEPAGLTDCFGTKLH